MIDGHHIGDMGEYKCLMKMRNKTVVLGPYKWLGKLNNGVTLERRLGIYI